MGLLVLIRDQRLMLKKEVFLNKKLAKTAKAIYQEVK